MWKQEAARVLDPALRRFEAISEKPLRRVLEIRAEACLQQLYFEFGDSVLTVAALPEDDSIECSISVRNQTTDGTDVSSSLPWRDFLGKSFGWGWLTFNQQGYGDGIMLGFDGIRPQVLLCVEASSIKVGEVSFE